VQDLCRSEKAGMYILTGFFVVNELCEGECPICCSHVVVSKPFVLGHPIAFEPSGFVIVVPVVGHIHMF
jgi:hypothetical protein